VAAFAAAAELLAGVDAAMSINRENLRGEPSQSRAEAAPNIQRVKTAIGF